MRTLIVAPDTLSDAVMTQPLTALLKRFDPDGPIDVLAGPAVAPVFEAMPGIDAVFSSRHALGPVRPWGKFLLARRIDRHRHDRVFVLPTAARAALVPWLAGIPIRIGLERDTRWGLINQPHDSGLHAHGGSRRPAVERYAHLAFDPSQPLPGKVPDPLLKRDRQREAATRVRAGLQPDDRLLVLCTGSDDGPSRRWPARHWAALIAKAAEEWPEYRPVLVGHANDRAFATEVAALSGQRPRNLCGDQSLTDAIATIAQAEAVVSHDSGLMHVAAAYSRPMVAVFGPTDPRFAPPRSARAKVEWLHQECSPCNQPTCRFGHGLCTSGVRPDTVFASLRTAMRFTTRDIR
jgi:heptosyltransferase-2